MFSPATMSNPNSIPQEPPAPSDLTIHAQPTLTPLLSTMSPQTQPLPLSSPNAKKKRSQPGNPDPEAEVIALSPKSLMTSNRFVCEICNKGFQRDQNLQLHRRGHNLPWKLRQKSSKDGVAMKKRVFVCPEVTCVHHHPSRALGDLTGIKKHYSRKHGEKKWKCEKCSKRYAVQSDWKAHVKACGTKDYRCDCGTLFSRKDSFITHRAFCDALAEESARLTSIPATTQPIFLPLIPTYEQLIDTPNSNYPDLNPDYAETNFHPSSSYLQMSVKPEVPVIQSLDPNYNYLLNFSRSSASNMITSSGHVSATALLQKASIIGPLSSLGCTSNSAALDHGIAAANNFNLQGLSTWQGRDQLTRDFLGVAACGEPMASQGGHHLLLDLVTASNYLSNNSEQFNNAGFPNLGDDC